MRTLVKHAHKKATLADALKWMCLATEYDELPVRHNEDLVNIELQKHLPIHADSWNLPMWDPHVKAFMIRIAWSRTELRSMT